MTAGLVDGMRESLAQCRRLARLTHDPTHRDSIVDVIGYAALLSEVTR